MFLPDVSTVADAVPATVPPIPELTPRSWRPWPARLPGSGRLSRCGDSYTARTAEVLGTAPGTVTAHLAPATAALRRELMPAQQQENPS